MINASLKSKLLLVIGLLVALIIVIAGVFWLALRDIRSNYDVLSAINLPITSSLQKQAYLGSRITSSINELILDLVLTGDADETDEIEQDVATLSTELDNYRDLIDQVVIQDNAPFLAVETGGQSIVASAVSVLSEDTEALTVENLVEIREEIEEIEHSFITEIEALIALEQAELLNNRRNVENATNSAVITVAVIFLLALAAIPATILYLDRSVTQPLNKLMIVVGALRGGNLTVRSKLNTQDEIGQLATTLNQLADTVQEKIAVSEAAREQAERSDQVKSAFLASMSHELRTPLNSIINFTRFVADGDTGPVNEQQAELLTDVIGSAKHLLALINDVLDMSKIEAGSLNLFIEEDIDLKLLLESALSTARSLLANKPVRLHADIAADLPLMRVDRHRILQILLNIVSNACKFTEEGEIQIRAQRSGDEVLISVADTGPGIAPEDQALVFEAFKQTTTGLRQAGGTGLGMPIAKNLAEIHGGRLWLESVVGQGATFYVALPVNAIAAVPATA
ncbi:MAG: HAMP domain-containing protein [Chloroflexi bacterium]|nr:HAMP domain-containing protein [Chloroflexota bacterium]